MFIVSVDVEEIRLRNGGKDFSTINNGVPLLLDLLDEFGIRATFFVTGEAAKGATDILQEVVDRKHEIGCHGYESDGQPIFRIEEETKRINHYLKVIPEGFRAHLFDINEDRLRSLVRLGYKYDSSVVPSSKVLNQHYLPKAPRTPYHPSLHNICQWGESPIVEIPIYTLPILGLPLGLSYVTLFGLKVYKYFLSNLDQEVVTLYLHPYDLFALHPLANVSFTFKLMHKRADGKGQEVLRGLLEYFETFSPKYICAREVLNYVPEGDQGSLALCK